jgi:hypothetical protein
MTTTGKRSLIFETVTATLIDIHPTGEEPDQHVIRVTPGSHVQQPFVKSLLSQNRGPTLRMKSWIPAMPGLAVILGYIILHQKTILKQGGAIEQSSYYATKFTGAHKPNMQSVQIKVCHRS